MFDPLNERDEAFLALVAGDPYISPRTKQAVAHDRERDRSPPKLSPNPLGSPSSDATLPSWAPVRDLEAQGVAASIVAKIESWFGIRNIDVCVKQFCLGAGGSHILRMGGTCFVCRREHSSNHWVLINSDGYETTRVLCHSSGQTKIISRQPF